MNDFGPNNVIVSQKHGVLIPKADLLREETFPEIGDLASKTVVHFLNQVGRVKGDLKLTINLEMRA